MLKSAVANAENNLGLDRDDLYVKQAWANDAPKNEEISPQRQRVTAYPILKRMSHIGVVVAERE